MSSGFNVAMANLIRSAKSGSSWTENELMAYNITIQSLPPDKFFPTPDPSLDHIDPAILNSPPRNTNPALSDATVKYLDYLRLAVRPTQESLITNFAAATLKLLRFNERPAAVYHSYTIPLVICGEANHVTRADACLLHSPTFILLILIEGKTFIEGANTEPEIVAGAIAAFQFNNRKRRDYGLDCLDAMTIPCIIMVGTRPTFYLIPVTAELSNAVITGQYPTTETQVSRCVTVATRILYTSTGMEDAEYRQLALKRFLAFKTLARSHWAHILKGV